MSFILSPHETRELKDFLIGSVVCFSVCLTLGIIFIPKFRYESDMINEKDNVSVDYGKTLSKVRAALIVPRLQKISTKDLYWIQDDLTEVQLAVTREIRNRTQTGSVSAHRRQAKSGASEQDESAQVTSKYGFDKDGRRLRDRFLIFAELPQVWSNAVPICVSSVLALLLPSVELAIIGKLGTTELAAASLGNTFFMLISHPLTGAASAMDTLFSHAFGAGNSLEYGDLLQVSQASMLIACVLLSTFLASAGAILRQLTDDTAVVEMAESYCLLLIPGIFPYFGYMIFTKYLQCQDIFWPSVYIAIVSNLASSGLCYALTRTDFGMYVLQQCLG